MFTTDVPERVVDLSLSEKHRWEQVIRKDRSAMCALAKQALKEMRSTSHLLLSPTLHWLWGQIYKLSGCGYQKELSSVAKAMGISPSLAAVLNSSYELSHLGTVAGTLGCSAGICQTENGELVHVRNLDWPLSKIGNATRVMRFTGGHHEFVAVGIAGFVGVLSGMVPGAYSVTINYAPPTGFSWFAPGPSFVLRRVLETCSTYDKAVDVLSRTPLSSSVLYLVCGTRSSEACVIERTPTQYRKREKHAGSLVVTNHFLSDLKKYNENLEEDSETNECCEFSDERKALLERRLKRARTMSYAFSALNEDWVLNEDTRQQMLFCPRTGQLKVGRWT